MSESATLPPDGRPLVLTNTADPDRLGIADAGYLLGRTYNQVLRDIMRGALLGGREGKHWWVSRDSVNDALVRGV